MTMADSPTRPARHADDAAIAAEVRRVREEYADEEAEAAEREAAENAAALDVSLSLRISRDLDEALKRRSSEEQISPSALARRLLRQALQAEDQPVLTTRQVGGDRPTRHARVRLIYRTATQEDRPCRRLLAPPRATKAQVNDLGIRLWRCLLLTRTRFEPSELRNPRPRDSTPWLRANVTRTPPRCPCTDRRPGEAGPCRPTPRPDVAEGQFCRTPSLRCRTTEEVT